MQSILQQVSKSSRQSYPGANDSLKAKGDPSALNEHMKVSATYLIAVKALLTRGVESGYPKQDPEAHGGRRHQDGQPVRDVTVPGGERSIEACKRCSA